MGDRTGDAALRADPARHGRPPGRRPVRRSAAGARWTVSRRRVGSDRLWAGAGGPYVGGLSIRRCPAVRLGAPGGGEHRSDHVRARGRRLEPRRRTISGCSPRIARTSRRVGAFHSRVTSATTQSDEYRPSNPARASPRRMKAPRRCHETAAETLRKSGRVATRVGCASIRTLVACLHLRPDAHDRPHRPRLTRRTTTSARVAWPGEQPSALAPVRRPAGSTAVRRGVAANQCATPADPAVAVRAVRARAWWPRRARRTSAPTHPSPVGSHRARRGRGGRAGRRWDRH